ncbi:MAG: type I-C CRISPR-associated protein Cas5c [Clostridia bacterium]
MKYENSITFEITGDYALFSDPISRPGGEKCTLQIPTYEAIKGILHSIYWKPTIIWFVDEIRIMNPIQTTSKGIRPIGYTGGNDLSYYTYLKDCRYKVKAHFEWNKNRPELASDRNEHKHFQITKRMLIRGGRRDIFLGTRECQGYVEPCDFNEGESFYENISEMAFGLMYHGITYADEAYDEQTNGNMTIRFWRPVMKNGVISFLRPDECEIVKVARSMKMKTFGEENFTKVDDFSELSEVL